MLEFQNIEFHRKKILEKKDLNRMEYVFSTDWDLIVCSECGGRRKISIYRHDLEDFDEIACPKCIEKE